MQSHPRNDNKFTFKRDARGIETVEHGGHLIATLAPKSHVMVGTHNKVIDKMIVAKELADAAGFWDTDDDGRFIWDECPIEVPS